MKILKIFGVVVSVHLIAFLFAVAIPGCRSTTRTSSSRPSNQPEAAQESPWASPSPAAGSSANVNVQSAGGGSTIVFPGASTPNSSPTRPSTPPPTAPAPAAEGKTYTVVPKDNLWAVAKKHGVSEAELRAANGLRSGAILRVGQKLVIPMREAPPPAAAALPPPKETRPADAKAAKPAGSLSTRTKTLHTVKAGESLEVIARRYGVSVPDLATLNSIGNPRALRVGAELVIPNRRGAEVESAPSPLPVASAPASSSVRPSSSSLSPSPSPSPAPTPTPDPSPFLSAPPAESPVEASPVQPAADNPFLGEGL